MLYMTNTRRVAESPTGGYSRSPHISHMSGRARCTRVHTISRITFLVQQFDMMVESYVFRISDQCPHLIIRNLTSMIKIRPNRKPAKLQRNTRQYLINYYLCHRRYCEQFACECHNTLCQLTRATTIAQIICPDVYQDNSWCNRSHLSQSPRKATQSKASLPLENDLCKHIGQVEI